MSIGDSTVSENKIDKSLADSDETEFVLTEDILANSYDDESTIAEAEAEEEYDAEEVDHLKKESEMPIEELLKLYGPPSSKSPPASPKPPTSKKQKSDSPSPKRANLDIVPSGDIPSRSSPRTSKSPTKITDGLITAEVKEPGMQETRLRKRNCVGQLVSSDNNASTTTKATSPNAQAQDPDVDDEDDEDFDEMIEDEDDSDNDSDEDEDAGVDKNNISSGFMNSSRLWCRALAPGGSLTNSNSYNSDEDEDYDPRVDASFHWKGHIRVGVTYQAELPRAPAPNKASIEDPPSAGCQLIWEPNKLSEEEVIDYMRRYATSLSVRLPKCRTPDDEEALFWLMQSDYDPEEALRRLKNRGVVPSDMPAYIKSWTEAECTTFEKGFAVYNKNFHQIRESKLKSKTVGEIVQFYYVWKKTARHDEFMRMYRKDKKKHHAHPGITDYMDCLALEQDSIGENYMQGHWTPGHSALPTYNSNRSEGAASSDDPLSRPGWGVETAEAWGQGGVGRVTPGTWCPVRTSLNQEEVDQLREEAIGESNSSSPDSPASTQDTAAANVMPPTSNNSCIINGETNLS